MGSDGPSFWGLAINGTEKVNVEVPVGTALRLAQAALGDKAKDKERVTVRIEVPGDPPFVLGTLVKGVCDQFPLELTFGEQEKVAAAEASGEAGAAARAIAAVEEEEADSAGDEGAAPAEAAVAAGGAGFAGGLEGLPEAEGGATVKLGTH
eukprot:jgi/Mesen1/6658/ME000340S05829